MTIKSILNRVFSTLFFYFGWAFCLHEVSNNDYPFYALFLILAFIVYSLYRSSHKKADIFLLGLVLIIGPLSDIFYHQLGLLHYEGQLSSWLPPLWVFSLWGLFAVNIQLFSWLKDRWYLSILLGALGGPLSYFSVVRLGGANMLIPLALIVIGCLWAVFFPGFIWLNNYLSRRFK